MSYNLFPDEKGTERVGATLGITTVNPVTTYSPTKRGLKDLEFPLARHALTGCYNLFPDEKGTESPQGRISLRRYFALQPIPRRKGD